MWKLENPFYFPGMTDEEAIQTQEAIVKNIKTNPQMRAVLNHKMDLIPVKDRTKEYIFNFLGIEQ